MDAGWIGTDRVLRLYALTLAILDGDVEGLDALTDGLDDQPGPFHPEPGVETTVGVSLRWIRHWMAETLDMMHAADPPSDEQWRTARLATAAVFRDMRDEAVARNVYGVE
jgi:hypothetical protein